MLLIVDANVLFAALISRGITAELIVSPKLKLIAPEFLLLELIENIDILSKKTRLSKEEFKSFLGVMMRRINFIPEKEFNNFLQKAYEISPENDFPYVALALYFKSKKIDVKIWSNDKGLKKRLKGLIKVISTEELLREMGR